MPIGRLKATCNELDPASAKFLDNLAKAQNDLWLRKRAIDDPTTTELQAPWPKGLPLQSLYPLPLSTEDIPKKDL